ncbi:hypothetical protein DMUE_2738 [Dictyocoela muelleri]|nr:hypothetical protein DMUE_2738 [Dictyocoela muelleri]
MIKILSFIFNRQKFTDIAKINLLMSIISFNSSPIRYIEVLVLFRMLTTFLMWSTFQRKLPKRLIMVLKVTNDIFVSTTKLIEFMIENVILDEFKGCKSVMSHQLSKFLG